MSNPLALLRKHQKVLLAVFGVLIMFVFVVGASLQQYLDSNVRGDRTGELVLTYTSGKLHENELQQFGLLHNQAVRFVQAIVRQTYARGGQPRAMPLVEAETEEQLVEILLLAQKAREMGVEISDDAIMNYLHALSDGEYEDSPHEFLRLLQEELGGALNEDALFSQLRTELLAQTMRLMALRGIDVIPPALAWEYYQRLHRRVSTELLPLDVSQYISKVKEPTEEELQAFFEKYKNDFAYPEFPEPGFKQRKKIAFQYFTIDFNKFLEEAMAQVTDEEIRAYYEANKEDFRALELPPSQAPGTGTEPATTTPANETPAATDPQGSSEPETTDPAGADPAEPEASPADPSPAGAAADTTPPSEAPSNTSEPAAGDVQEPEVEQESDEEASAPANVPAPGDQSARSRVAAQFVAFQQEEPTEDAADEEAVTEVTPDATEEAAEEQPDAAAPDAAPAEATPSAEPANEQPTGEEPGTETEPATESSTDPTPPAPQPGSAEAAKEATPAGETKYKPLEEVRDEIRRLLASPRAQQQQEKVVSEARRTVDRYHRLYEQWVAAGKEGAAPEEPNFQEIAQSLGIEFSETPLVNELEIAERDLGQAYDFRMFTQVPFAATAYREGIAMYRPEVIQGAEGDLQHLWWKKDQREAYVPQLKAIRSQVVRDWKMARAFILAQDDARKQAALAEKANKPLAEVFPESAEKIVTTGPFSWLSRGSVPFGPGTPVLSDVPKVPAAGEEFMEDVFSAPVGSVTVTANRPQTYVYVARVQEQMPSQEALRDQFLNSGGLTQDVMTIAYGDRVELFRKWYENLQQEMDVEWVRSPDSE